MLSRRLCFGTLIIAVVVGLSGPARCGLEFRFRQASPTAAIARPGHYTVCPKDPDDHSYKFWIITQVRMQAGSAKETWSDGGLISMRRYSSEAACRTGIGNYEDYPSKVPYNLKDGVMVGDVCVEVFIPDMRELLQGAR